MKNKTLFFGLIFLGFFISWSANACIGGELSEADKEALKARVVFNTLSKKEIKLDDLWSVQWNSFHPVEPFGTRGDCNAVEINATLTLDFASGSKPGKICTVKYLYKEFKSRALMLKEGPYFVELSRKCE